MAEIKVMIIDNSPHSGYGYYEKGDTGVVVGFTQGCAVVIRDKDSKFVKVELRELKKLKEE